MSRIITGRQKILIAHVCSKCGEALIQEPILYTDGRANAFFHEKEKAEHARELAENQAFKDIALCYQSPRQLGSMTEVNTNENREWAFYQIEKLDAPCTKCGHVEAWQLRKKSLWNPVDGPFQLRDRIPDVPVESRPFLLDNMDAAAAWLANPKNPENAEKMSATGTVTEKERIAAVEDKVWTCAKCGTNNVERIKTCQGCGVSKQWSDAKTAKKAK